eukprot:9073302-Pyramimonas_sp.AAC.1
MRFAQVLIGDFNISDATADRSTAVSGLPQQPSRSLRTSTTVDPSPPSPSGARPLSSARPPNGVEPPESVEPPEDVGLPTGDN